MDNYSGVEIAVIGMSGRFPGAGNVGEFWNNLAGGVESIQKLTEKEILDDGEEARMLQNPLYIKAASSISGKEFFDSEFFGYRPEEAKMMNPQIRLFHECCWNAIEDAGYNVYRTSEKIGLFAGGATDVNWENYT